MSTAQSSDVLSVDNDVRTYGLFAKGSASHNKLNKIVRINYVSSAPINHIAAAFLMLEVV